MPSNERVFKNPESAVNAVHIQSLTQSIAFIATVVLLYLFSAIALLCIIAFDLPVKELSEQSLVALSLFGLSPLGLSLFLWRTVQKIICWRMYVYGKKHLSM
jgi:hypothetical protein